MKIQRMFSNVEEERLYSTGNDELDDLLERAFCEGYEFAQKEYTEKKSRKERRKVFVDREIDLGRPEPELLAKSKHENPIDLILGKKSKQKKKEEK